MPIILDLESGNAYTLSPGTSFLVGRSQEADLQVRDLTCSRKQFRINVREDLTCRLTPLSRVSPTFCEGIALYDAVEIDRDIDITAGKSTFRFLLGDDPLAVAPAVPIAMVADPVTQGSPCGELQAVRLDRLTVIGRDPGVAQIVLRHCQVSRRHAQILPDGEEAVLKDLNSTAGTFLNGRRITSPQRVHHGDSIGIGPYQLTLEHGFWNGTTRANNVQLVGRGLTKLVPDRLTGHPKTILSEVSLVARPRELVGLMGPAGCGKSTLLAALSAQTPVDSGSVMLNQLDLSASFDLLKRELAVVPQHDTLHAELTVTQALSYSAQLRLPLDTSSEEIDYVVLDTMNRVGLYAQRHTRIADLSQVQTKRTSLALELLGDPSLIFLDEVTSGLDEPSDREMMELFRQLADDGKTVVCNTQNLANVERNCHLVVVLAEAGNLAFVGRPDEALFYFDVDQLGDIYDRLKQRSPKHWKQDFVVSPAYAEYVGSRLASERPASPPSAPPAREVQRRTLKMAARQTSVLLRRNAQLLWADKPALAAKIGQCILIGGLIALVFGNITPTGRADPQIDLAQRASHSSAVLFLAAVSCFWFGCNNAAKVFVKDRGILLREYQNGLGIPEYYLAKLLPLALLSVAQALILYGIVAVLCQLPGYGWRGGATLGLVSIVGVTLGLCVSAVARSETIATSLVPVVLVAQIILAAGLKPLDGAAERIAQLVISSYWGFGLLRSTLPDALTAYLAAAPTSIAASIAMLSLHAALCAATALYFLRRESHR